MLDWVLHHWKIRGGTRWALLRGSFEHHQQYQSICRNFTKHENDWNLIRLYFESQHWWLSHPHVMNEWQYSSYPRCWRSKRRVWHPCLKTSKWLWIDFDLKFKCVWRLRENHLEIWGRYTSSYSNWASNEALLWVFIGSDRFKG